MKEREKEKLEGQFFHHYETKENIVTANTMSLFMHLYCCDPNKFFRFLKELLKKKVKDFDPGNFEQKISFRLQERNIDDAQKKRLISVPDASIQGNSFKIVIETKLDGSTFSLEQLKKHLESFTSEEHKILVTLASSKMSDNTLNEFEEYLESCNESPSRPISHVNLTLKNLVDALKEILDEKDCYKIKMSKILDDYERYCDHNDLFVDPSHRMIARPVGSEKNKNSTYEINNRYKVYFNRQAPDYASSYSYLGLYRDKSICAIGKICDQITICEIENEKLKNLLECEESKDAIKKVIRAIKLECEEEKKDNLTDNEQTVIEERKDTIKKVIEKMLLDHGDKTILRKQRYYFVEEFHETNFKKVSRYGLLKSKKFNLEKELGKDNLAKILGKNEHNAKGIAEALKGKTWE